ncbi:bifunctional N(6)-L-threonylcarbamoyladenine synthase/serine/threonine protein kinase [Halorhabdus sp. BNX81]|uniref:bifunctional N(6)-L-threonylcarbamoyladenine synthase/serine/threonine protein kinase n=1 Tax=Halorhabdus sp. BNX81 TaxID=2980181 RepID=UPI0023DD18B9|nr:bifunctional N(6)-L-threonylcarbamoyladenine synthase/serine/threonine protein kinase [Halorhabdus sp. BNX81]WEL22596.1 Bifunctional N6-L-threonylcarbamoyladenine synthase / protein kinase Bud32 [Halorhabdus sp. BNX81]
MAPTGTDDVASADRILGIEGTAWAASAAVYDVEADDVTIETDAYEPDSGGIHPQEAAEHMREAIPQVVERALDIAREQAADAGEDPDESPVDAVAFSRGPGLGPCLRIVATAARALAQRLDVPLVGVNHMVAHLEIGRHRSGFSAPVCLNASGANAHILGYRNGRYRVLGETMDTGVGNAIDKFTRHLGWSHPGGPKVEKRAKDGEYIDLPYVVKGMDFSFSGIMSAAKQAIDDGEPVEDVCYSLQENIFAMLTEVAERALSLSDADELVLGGGVGQNDRLREMLGAMCDQRGADFYAPEPRFLRDNAGMIAVLGAKMYDAGDTIAVEDSRVRPDFRPDEVDVTWRSDKAVGSWTRSKDDDAVQGAEATVTVEDGRVRKERQPRTYRHPTLDERLRTERTREEARLTSEARRVGVPTPVVHDVDPKEGVLVFERVGERDLREALTLDRVRDVGRHLATIHDAGFVHGDPTTRNVRISEDRTHLIDFGLGYYTGHAEDHAMDLHVFAQSLAGTADDAETLQEAAEEAYRESSGRGEAVLDRLREIEGRGRYQ